MALGFLSQQGLGGGMRNGVMTPGANYQLGQQGWQQGNGIALPMSSGDHMPIVNSPLSRPPPRQGMAPGQPFVQHPQQQGGGGGMGQGQSNAQEPWNQPGWTQPTPAYNPAVWGTGAIGWGGAGNAPPPPTAMGGPGGGMNNLAQPFVAPVTAGAPGSGFMGAGMPPGQWQSVIQGLLGSQGSPMDGSAFSDPNFLRMILSGLGGYR